MDYVQYLDCGDDITLVQTHQNVYIKYVEYVHFFVYQVYLNKAYKKRKEKIMIKMYLSLGNNVNSTKKIKCICLKQKTLKFISCAYVGEDNNRKIY